MNENKPAAGADAGHILFYTINGTSYGLPLSSVVRVIRAVAITPLPEAPDTVLGVINVQGRIIPVVNMRLKLRLKNRAVDIEDKLIIARTSISMVALAVDAVEGVVKHSDAEVTKGDEVLAGLENLVCVIKLNDTPIPIHDLDRFLSPELKGYMHAGPAAH